MNSIPDKCPKCGCEYAISKERVSGTAITSYNLITHEADFSAIHDLLDYHGGTILYCWECGRKLGKTKDFEIKENSLWPI